MANMYYPDRHLVNAAIGWLELHAPAEARAELEALSPAHAFHPDTLAAWWRVHAAEQRWDEALRVAELEVMSAPEAMSGWVDRSYSLHELQRTAEARDALLPAVKKFPEASLIPYNLACYACRLGNPAEARQWLLKAIARGEKAEIKALALEDPDLALLREEIALW